MRVLVNGEAIVENGKLTGARAGRILRVGNPNESVNGAERLLDCELSTVDSP